MFAGTLLVPGSHCLDAGLVAILPKGEKFLDRRVDAAIFNVVSKEDGDRFGRLRHRAQPVSSRRLKMKPSTRDI